MEIETDNVCSVVEDNSSTQWPELPDVNNAKLPAVYKSAKNAIAECARIDECKDWSDKAQAMASYAKQASDDSLLRMARRIQARATARCGELLKQIEPASGKRSDLEPTDGSDSRLTRKSAAQQAGLSERQQFTALQVANIPEDEREALIESEDPPTVSQLANQGKKTKPKPLVDLGDINPEDYKRATEAQGTLRRFSDFCLLNNPVKIAKSYQPHELARLREYVANVDAWLDQFITNLPE